MELKMSGIDEMIQRINELYHKSQAEGLTAEEKDVRNNLKGQLNNISIVEKDGTITNLGEKHGKNDC